MTLAGFRPALKSEYEEYEYHHRARIAMKPGITGMWQVSGRSDITDFEEVVKLDTEYIRNWSISDYEFLDWKPLVSANREECPGAVHNALIDDSVKIEE